MENETTQYPNLKRQIKSGENFRFRNLELWTEQNILDGLRKFFSEHGRYPTALEIDAYEYLPSSRQIQRLFGGLVKLRQKLGLEITNYGIGSSKSAIAKVVNSRGRESEKEMEKELICHFGEYFVHVEKPLDKYYTDPSNFPSNGKNRADFFIYGKNYQFCVDVFYPTHVHNFVSTISIKEQKYRGLKIDAYLVNMNDTGIITNERIKLYKKQRLGGPLDKNIILINKTPFIKLVKSLEPLHVLQ